ncbi:MAG: cytochrome c-type biogenesis protein CcmH [Nitrosomonas sp.]|nr:cytochrome c-type biogenesis protein CcmH [Nitrosomonas sp.]MDP1951582.1 cytochrome c-type biogenesis protein CcmH [Nitrosomonas sp.]
MMNHLNNRQAFKLQNEGRSSARRELRVKLLLASFLLALFLVPLTGWAGNEAPLVAEDPVVEKRMIELTQNLRCLVCQNESIADSHADFSNDIRREIRAQIRANKTDQEIIEFMVERYGDFVLYDPPIKPTTFLLWFGPLILFISGLAYLIIYLRRRRLQVEEAVPLSENEKKQVEALLNENK